MQSRGSGPGAECNPGTADPTRRRTAPSERLFRTGWGRAGAPGFSRSGGGGAESCPCVHAP
nr:MAG TPA: hypothetical protein [Caudoviricetes sp.]